MGAEAVQPGGPGSVLSAQGVTLGGDQALALAAYTQVQVTPNLPVGTYIIEWGVTVSNGNAAAGTLEAGIFLGMALGVFTGQPNAEGELPGVVGQTAALAVSCIAVITTAGTISFAAKAPGAAASTAKANTPTSASVGATGWTALRIA